MNAGKLKVMSRARSLSAAGRLLFSSSRQQNTSTNDADRLRNYFSRFGLDFKTLRETWDGVTDDPRRS